MIFLRNEIVDAVYDFAPSTPSWLGLLGPINIYSRKIFISIKVLLVHLKRPLNTITLAHRHTIT